MLFDRKGSSKLCDSHDIRWLPCRVKSSNCDRKSIYCRCFGGRMHRVCIKCREMFDEKIPIGGDMNV